MERFSALVVLLLPVEADNEGAAEDEGASKSCPAEDFFISLPRRFTGEVEAEVVGEDEDAVRAASMSEVLRRNRLIMAAWRAGRLFQ